MRVGRGGKGKWGASVARRSPCRWNPLLLPGGVRPRFCPCNVRPLGRQLRGNCERLVIVGTCVMSRCGGLIPIGNRAFTALVDPVSPPSATAVPRSAPPLLVEAPGYCPPGPKCLFHPTLYRHSRLPGPLKIGICTLFFKQLTKSARRRNRYGVDGVGTVQWLGL